MVFQLDISRKDGKQNTNDFFDKLVNNQLQICFQTHEGTKISGGRWRKHECNSSL